MKVFLSWSGEQSKAIAEILRSWLPSVLQAVKPYFSPDDVAKGSRWSSEIAKELDASSVGLLIVTPKNQTAPWLLFEAGALAKNLDKSKVCPLLFGGLEPTEVKGPLVQFQAANFSRDEVKRVVMMINSELGEAALQTNVFDKVFDMWWPTLSSQVEAALAKPEAGKGKDRRTDRDMLEEILMLTRRESFERRAQVAPDHPAWDDLAEGMRRLFRAQSRANTLPDPSVIKTVEEMMFPLRVLSTRRLSSKALDRLFRDFESYLHSYGAYAKPPFEASDTGETTPSDTG